jgi:hypothetical protein
VCVAKNVPDGLAPAWKDAVPFYLYRACSLFFTDTANKPEVSSRKLKKASKQIIKDLAQDVNVPREHSSRAAQ